MERIILDLGVILVAGLIGGGIFTRLRLPAAVGMILAGITLSPFTPGYTVDASGELKLIAQLGAILIMFTIGLHFDHRYLKRVGFFAFALAAVACGATFLAGIAAGTLMGLSGFESLLLGVFFVATSTTISLGIIDEMGLSGYPNADILKAAIVIDDLYGFFALTLLTAEIGAIAQSIKDIASTVVYTLTAVVVIFYIGVKVVPRILAWAEEFLEGSSLTLAAAFCLFLSYGVVSLKVSPLIGAFLAGTILTSSINHKNIIDTVTPLMTLFGGVFFISVGLQIDPSLLGKALLLSTTLTLVAIASKALPAALFLRWMGTPPKEALALGIATGPRGEVLLIVAQAAVLSGTVGSIYLAVATSIVLLSTLATPALIKAVTGKLYGSNV